MKFEIIQKDITKYDSLLFPQNCFFDVTGALRGPYLCLARTFSDAETKQGTSQNHKILSNAARHAWFM